jgi:hypothetical protein
MATIIFALLWQLQITDPSPLDPHLHGPHTHGAGRYPSLAECVKAGKEMVRAMNRSKGFRPDAKPHCYSFEAGPAE